MSDDSTMPAAATDAEQRMAWWRKAKLGMFVHWAEAVADQAVRMDARHGGMTTRHHIRHDAD